MRRQFFHLEILFASELVVVTSLIIIVFCKKLSIRQMFPMFLWLSRSAQYHVCFSRIKSVLLGYRHVREPVLG